MLARAVQVVGDLVILVTAFMMRVNGFVGCIAGLLERTDDI